MWCYFWSIQLNTAPTCKTGGGGVGHHSHQVWSYWRPLELCYLESVMSYPAASNVWKWQRQQNHWEVSLSFSFTLNPRACSSMVLKRNRAASLRKLYLAVSGDIFDCRDWSREMLLVSKPSYSRQGSPHHHRQRVIRPKTSIMLRLRNPAITTLRTALLLKVSLNFIPRR